MEKWNLQTFTGEKVDHVEVMPGVLAYTPKKVTAEEQAAAVRRSRERMAALREKWAKLGLA